MEAIDTFIRAQRRYLSGHYKRRLSTDEASEITLEALIDAKQTRDAKAQAVRLSDKTSQIEICFENELRKK